MLDNLLSSIWELITIKFLKNIELLKLEDNENVLEYKYTKLHNAQYNKF